MNPTSVGAMPSPLAVGSGVVSFDSVAVSALSVDEIRNQIFGAPVLPTLLIPSVDKRFAVEPDRTVYTIDNDLLVNTGDLERITGGQNGRTIIIQVADALRTVTAKDGGEIDDDEEGGLFILPGGDFELRFGDALALTFNSALWRWIERGRVWASEAYVDPAGPVALHVHPGYALVSPTAPPDPRDGFLWLNTSATGTGGTGLLARVTTTTDLTLTVFHTVVLVDASSGPLTITLPPASTNGGRLYHIKKADPSANPVTIDGDGDDTVEGESAAVLTEQWECLTLNGDSDEDNWDIL